MSMSWCLVGIVLSHHLAVCDADFLSLQAPKGCKLKEVQDAFAPFGFEQEEPTGW